MKYFLIAYFALVTFFLNPFATGVLATDLSPAVSELSKNFSEKFCISIETGMTPEKAGENTAAQLSKGLLFSPVMKELMSAPKDYLAESLSNNIFDGCGNELAVTKEELNDYLMQLANKVPTKSSNGLQLPMTRQTSSQLFRT